MLGGIGTVLYTLTLLVPSSSTVMSARFWRVDGCNVRSMP